LVAVFFIAANVILFQIWSHVI